MNLTNRHYLLTGNEKEDREAAELFSKISGLTLVAMNRTFFKVAPILRIVTHGEFISHFRRPNDTTPITLSELRELASAE